MARKKNMAAPISPLEGQALVAKVKDLGNLSKEQKARACGYYTVTKNGVERVNMMKFLNALIDAEGIELDSKVNGNGRGGRSASYRISVQSNGNLLIGSAYTKQMGLQPGDQFEITLGRKHIHLKQVDEAEEEALEAS
ncbi:MAG: AbrB family transcriptional regulator [Moorea sp. SIO2I5]|nr:AbrB family transcriptional regulator [Moorena sp. SIO2I5]